MIVVRLLLVVFIFAILLLIAVSIFELNNDRSVYRVSIVVSASQTSTFVRAQVHDQSGKRFENYIYSTLSKLPPFDSGSKFENLIYKVFVFFYGNQNSLTGKPILDASIEIDGQDVGVLGTTYVADLKEVWEEGSSHNVSISTPDGYSETVTIRKPNGGLEGLIFDPPISTFPAQSYNVSYPNGNWPEGSRIDYTMTTKSRASSRLHRYGYTCRPTGNSITKILTDCSKIFVGSGITKQIDFNSSLEFWFDLPEYAPGSAITVTGNESLVRSGNASELTKIPGGAILSY